MHKNKFTCITLILIVVFPAIMAKAQQMIVDDSAVTGHRMLQFDAWYGTESSWIAPAFGIAPRWETLVGFGMNSKNYFSIESLQWGAKTVFSDLEENGQAFGLTTGIFWDQNFRVEEVYMIVPYSRIFSGLKTVLHVNVGLGLHNKSGGMHMIPHYGSGAEFYVHERVALMAEFFAEGADYFGHGGIKISLVPDVLEMDISWGSGIQSPHNFPGLNVGIAYTSGRVW